ncbi:hypothetical protein ACLOJK_028656 [Asimina triloba]
MRYRRSMELEMHQGVLAWPLRKLKNNANKLCMRLNERVYVLLKSIGSLEKLLSFENDWTNTSRGRFCGKGDCMLLTDIWNCEELVSISEEKYGLLQEDEEDGGLPSSLTNIKLLECPNIRSLRRGLHALTSLHALEIHSKGLPSSLQTLMIWKRGACKTIERLKNVEEGARRASMVSFAAGEWRSYSIDRPLEKVGFSLVIDGGPSLLVLGKQCQCRVSDKREDGLRGGGERDRE